MQTNIQIWDVYRLLLCMFRSKNCQLKTRYTSSQMHALLRIVHSAILIRQSLDLIAVVYFSSLQAISGFQERCSIWNALTHTHTYWNPCRLCFATIHTGDCLAANWESDTGEKYCPLLLTSNWNQWEWVCLTGRFHDKLYYFESERWSTITSRIQHVIHARLNLKGARKFSLQTNCNRCTSSSNRSSSSA